MLAGALRTARRPAPRACPPGGGCTFAQDPYRPAPEVGVLSSILRSLWSRQLDAGGQAGALFC